MQAVVRSSVMAGVALAGGRRHCDHPPPDVQIANQTVVGRTAGEFDDRENIALTLFPAFANIDTNDVNAINDLTDAQDRTQVLVHQLVPFPALSKRPGKRDLSEACFRVPLSQLMSGYSFPDSGPTVFDPNRSAKGASGFAGTHVGPDGSDVYRWVGATFTRDLAKPFAEFINILTAAPSDKRLEPLPDVIRTFP